MAKTKKDVIIDGVTYKNIDVNEYSYSFEKKLTYYIPTTGIAQIIKQFVKNNYGDIKVWAKSESFAGGSSVDVYLWNVPDDWYKKINNFAETFGMYHDYGDGGDGYWRGSDVGATLTDGTSVSNHSPYMHVSNTPPYDSKERDMPPPDYSTTPKKGKEYPEKKKFEKKGSKFSPTENLDLILDCGNGWKIYVGKPKEKYLYSAVKDQETKPNKEQWAEIKGDMLNVGFMWNWKNGTFQRWTSEKNYDIPQDACEVLSKYWKVEGAPKKEETPKEVLPFYLKDKVALNKPYLDEENRLWGIDSIGTIISIDYGSKIAYIDFLNDNSRIPVPFSYLDKYTEKETPSEETPREGGKIPLVKIVDVWGNFGVAEKEFTNYEDLEKEFFMMEIPKVGYDKYKFKFEWADGSYIVDRIDVGYLGFDFNPSVQTFEDYVKKLYNKPNYTVMYDYKMKEPFSQYSLDFMSTTTKNVDIDTYINDLEVLLSLENDVNKQFQLAQYIGDLKTLKLLEN